MVEEKEGAAVGRNTTRRRRFIIIKVCRALSSHNGGRVRARRDRPAEEGRKVGFDNGHIKAALLPEKGDDEPRRFEAELPKNFQVWSGLNE